ncbi:MAG: sulfite exporter TauE/SafE family protein [Woeseiaceae bacterium]|nr:sulfite exporter TauE/SafE family protein [Woeseiaceae bacterium]
MIQELGPTIILLIAVASFATGLLHGATGMAGGVVMAAILANIVSIKVAVPVMTIALIFSHLSRAIMYVRETDWSVAGRVLLFGGPMIVVGALIFSKISPTAIAIVFAAFLICSFPVKRWAKKHELSTGPGLLAGASVVWGLLAGNVIGPGFFLAPFLLGTGMNRMTFVGTLATITFVMNILKVAVFGATALVNIEILVVGVAVGLISIPGNWVGRNVLRNMRDSDHHLIIDVLTLMMIINFLYIAFK